MPRMGMGLGLGFRKLREKLFLYFPFLTSINPTVGTLVSNTCASGTSTIDYLGRQLDGLPNEAMFYGMRRVHNLLSPLYGTNDLTNWVKYKDADAILPIVTVNYSPAPAELGNVFASRVQLNSGLSGNSQITAYLIKIPTDGIHTFFARSLSSPVEVSVFGFGNVKSILIATSWTRVSYYNQMPTSNEIRIAKRIAWGTAGSADLLICGVMVQESRGDTAVGIPDEYVSVGILSEPYHGAGIDGVKVFNTSKSHITVLNNIITESDNKVLLTTGKGVQSQPASTNLFLNSHAPATQDVITAAQKYTVHVDDNADGSIILTGTMTGAVSAGNPVTATATAGTLTCTVSGAINVAQVEALSFSSNFIRTLSSTVSRDDTRLAGLWGVGLNKFRVTFKLFYQGYDSVNDAYLCGVGSGALTESLQSYIRASDGKLRFIIYIGSTGYGITSNAAIVVGTEPKIELVYDGGMSIVIDDVVQVDTNAVVADMGWSGAQNLYLGSDYAGDNPVFGSIENFKVVES